MISSYFITDSAKLLELASADFLNASEGLQYVELHSLISIFIL